MAHKEVDDAARTLMPPGAFLGPGPQVAFASGLPMAGAHSGRVVCTECPWRLRHEFPENGGWICRFHVEKFDGMPAIDVLERFFLNHGFKVGTLDAWPTRVTISVLRIIRARLR